MKSTTDTHCSDCVYYASSTRTCDYILTTDRMRPCPAGEGCTERYTRKEATMAKATWDTAAAYDLYLAGKSDKEISEALNVPIGSVSFYRKKHWGGTIKSPVKKQKEVESVPEITKPEQQTTQPSGRPDPTDVFSIMEAATSDLKGIQAICTANAIQDLWNWKTIYDLQRARASIDYLLKKLGEGECCTTDKSQSQ